jgi:hypothetical protein
VLAKSIADGVLVSRPAPYLNLGYRVSRCRALVTLCSSVVGPSLILLSSFYFGVWQSTSAVLSYYLPTSLKEWFWGKQFGIDNVGKAML